MDTPSNSTLWLCVLSCVALVGGPWSTPARADHSGLHSWSDPAGGLFNDAANWDLGVPKPSDTAVFDLGAGVNPYVVDFTGAFGPIIDVKVNRALVVGDDPVVFDLAGGTYLLSSTTDPGVIVGDTALAAKHGSSQKLHNLLAFSGQFGDTRGVLLQ